MITMENWDTGLSHVCPSIVCKLEDHIDLYFITISAIRVPERPALRSNSGALRRAGVTSAGPTYCRPSASDHGPPIDFERDHSQHQNPRSLSPQVSAQTRPHATRSPLMLALDGADQDGRRRPVTGPALSIYGYRRSRIYTLVTMSAPYSS
jgi:hypothetical protein